MDKGNILASAKLLEKIAVAKAEGKMNIYVFRTEMAAIQAMQKEIDRLNKRLEAACIHKCSAGKPEAKRV